VVDDQGQEKQFFNKMHLHGFNFDENSTCIAFDYKSQYQQQYNNC
jgi:hypothetical protein